MKEAEGKNALIFIHGSGENSNSWKSQLKLSLNYNLIALDLPSHGNSGNFPELSLDLYTNVIKEVIEKLQLKNIILCGHSLGGAIAQNYYFKYPNDLHALILIGTGAKLRVSPIILESLRSNFQAYLNSIPISAFYRKTSPEIIESYIKEVVKTNPKVTYSDFKICDNFDVMQSVHLIDIPCLILCADGDKLTPIKYSQYFHEKVKNSVLKIIKNAGHVVMLEKPDEVNQSIINFIENYLNR